MNFFRNWSKSQNRSVTKDWLSMLLLLLIIIKQVLLSMPFKPTATKVHAVVNEIQLKSSVMLLVSSRQYPGLIMEENKRWDDDEINWALKFLFQFSLKKFLVWIGYRWEGAKSEGEWPGQEEVPRAIGSHRRAVLLPHPEKDPSTSRGCSLLLR